jgi:hypothetical protein
MRPGDEHGLQSEARRHAYRMTLVYAVVVPASGLLAVLAFTLDAWPVAVGFGVVSGVCYWQLRGWLASTGHGAFSRAYVSDVVQSLDVPRIRVRAVLASYFVVLALVVPTIAIVEIVT